MPFKKGQPGGPGRPKSEKTLKKEALAKTVTAAKAEAKAAVEVARVSSGQSKDKAAPKAGKGITPVDLMLDAMREAWSVYKTGGIEVAAIRDRGLELIDEANHLTPTEGEADAAFKRRKAEALAAGHEVLEQAAKRFDRASADLNRALECAKAAAPYTSAKLQTSTIQGEMELTVNLKQYGPAKAKPKSK